MADVEFRVLGPVEAARNGEPVAVGGTRQRTLLALLVLQAGRPVAIGRLVEELWHGDPPARAATTLRSYVSRLRNALQVPLEGGAGAYSLDISAEKVDAFRFERLAREGEEALAMRRPLRARERLQRALELWRGHPFGELGGEGALRLEAERLERLHLLALENRIEAELALGRGAELLDELEALVREEPYRERAWRQLMLALYRAGRQADALAAYRRARAILAGELGLEPSEELRGLEQAILRHEVPEPVAPEQRHNLPAPVTSFVGRETELAEVAGLLEEGRLVTLSGVGGAGKTRLALEVAWRALPDFADGVFFADLSGLAGPGLVAGHVAAALGLRPVAGGTATAQLSAHLRDAELLLVLDNCEHLREACAELVATLLAGAPWLRVLATSRELLGAPGEIDYPVPPLTLPPPGASPDELRASEAVRLLLVRASAARPHLDESAALASAGRICRDLDGLPLAIELAAARAKALTLEEIASRLSDRFRFLVSWRRLTAARHRTLREAMDWSYELLAEEERKLLAGLSVFAGGFTLAAVAEVCLGGDEERALELLQRLVDSSLVVAEERNGSMRYGLLETVREYASTRLREDPQAADEATVAHGSFFAALVDDGDGRRPDEAQGSLIDDDLENLRAAIDNAARRGDSETELRLVAGLWRYWWVRGYVQEGRTRIEAALERRGPVDGLHLTRALIGGAGLASTQGDHDRAYVLGEQALVEARACGSVVHEVNALNMLGVAAMRAGAFDAARAHLEEGMSIAEDHGLLDAIALRLNLGLVELLSDHPEKALSIFEELLEVHRRTGPFHQGVGFAAINLGRALYALDELERAKDAFAEARSAFGSIGFRAHCAHSLQGLAAVEARAGDAETGTRLLGEAAAMLEEVGASDEDFDPELVADARSILRSRLGEAEFEAAFGEGEARAARLVTAG